MAEVNASITQLFKDKLKPGQTAQTPVYPKTVSDAVRVPKYKGASQSMTETLTASLGKKVGFQVTLICPNDWKYLYSFSDTNSFNSWVTALCADSTITKDALWDITSGSRWGTYTQDKLEELDNIYISNGSILYKTPLYNVTANSSTDPDNPGGDEPDPPTPPPMYKDPEMYLSFPSGTTLTYYTTVEDAVNVSNIYDDLEGLIIKGNAYLTDTRIKISCLAQSGKQKNFSPYLTSPTYITGDDSTSYVTELTLTKAEVNSSINSGITINFHVIDTQCDDINYIKIECLDLGDLIDPIYIGIRNMVTDSIIYEPATVENLPITVKLANTNQDGYCMDDAFIFRTSQNQTEDITIKVNSPTISGVVLPFYMYIQIGTSAYGINNQTEPQTITSDRAIEGVIVHIGTIPFGTPLSSAIFPEVSTTTNNYGTITVEGVGSSPIVIAKLEYKYFPVGNNNGSTKVTVSPTVSYIPITEDNSVYSVDAATIDSLSGSVVNFLGVEKVNFKQLLGSAYKESVYAMHFTLRLEGIPKNTSLSYYTFLFTNYINTSDGYKYESINYVDPDTNAATTLSKATYHMRKVTKKIKGAEVEEGNWATISSGNGTVGVAIAANTEYDYIIEDVYYPLESHSTGTDNQSKYTACRQLIMQAISNGNMRIHLFHSDYSAMPPTKLFNPESPIESIDINVVNSTPLQDFNTLALKETINNNLGANKDFKASASYLDNVTDLPAYSCMNLNEDISELDLSEYTNMKSVGDYAFYNSTAIEKITLPNSIVSIGAGAFKGCENLELINIPTNMKVIKSETFYNTRVVTDTLLQAIVVPNKVTTLGDYAFANNTNVGKVTIPANMLSIGTCCFENCTNLDTVTFSGTSKLRVIGDGAFHNCPNLDTITLPGSLTTLGVGAFDGCASLESISVPDNVTLIGDWLFSDCTNLQKVHLGANISGLPNGIFAGCTSLTDLYLYFVGEEGGPVGVVWPAMIGKPTTRLEQSVIENENFIIHVPSTVLTWYQENTFWLSMVNNNSSRIVAIED